MSTTTNTIQFHSTSATHFNSLVSLHAHPQTKEIYVCEQVGRIWRLNTDVLTSRSKDRRELVLDLTERMIKNWNKHYDERGLLDFNFNSQQPEMYVFYSAYVSGQKSGLENVVSRFEMNEDGTVNDESEVELLRIPKQNVYHNGGRLLFRAPHTLFISVGDDGPQGYNKHAQNPNSYHGKIWNLNVNTGQLKLHALGLRNPWSMTWDEPNDRLFVGDAGYQTREEINIVDPVRSGQNFGWSLFEGSIPTSWSDAQLLKQMQSKVVMPIYEYPTMTGGTVIGGYYIGNKSGYVFGDFNGTLFNIRERSNGTWFLSGENHLPDGWMIKSFGRDAHNNVYVLVDQSAAVKSGAAAVWRIEIK